MSPKQEGPKWAIIYSGLDVYLSSDGDWIDAPNFGVLAIVYQSPETGWSIGRTNDYYVNLGDNEFLAIGLDAVVDYAVNVFKVATINHIGSPTTFALNQSGRLVDKDGLILFLLEEGHMKAGRMVTRTEWAQATGLAQELMISVKKTAKFDWEGVNYGLSS